MKNDVVLGTVNYPTYIMGFINVITKKIKDYGMLTGNPIKSTAVPDKLIVPVISKKYAYCYEGINLVKKTIERLGLNCTMTKYKINIDSNNNDESYEYHFTITKK